MQRKPKIRIRTSSIEVFRKVASTVCAFCIMTPRDRFECCKPGDSLDEQLQIMRRKGFDGIPMLKGTDLKSGEISEYLSQENIENKIAQRFMKCKEASTRIEEEDQIREDLPMEEVISRFSSRKNKSSVPLFLRNENKHIVGLITLADLDKTAVKMYLFALMSELELSLLEIISKDYDRVKEICKCKYCLRKRKARKNQMHSNDNLEEYFYLNLKELIHMIIRSESSSESQRRVKNALVREGHGEIVKLRNTIVHPKPLVSDKFPINKLARIHSLVKNLLLMCKNTYSSGNKPHLETRCLNGPELTENIVPS